MDLSVIRETDVRRWRKGRLAAGPQQKRPFGPVTVAKAYRLLHSIMNTAVEDGKIRRNPCRIKGAGQEYSQARSGHDPLPGSRYQRASALSRAKTCGMVGAPKLSSS